MRSAGNLSPEWGYLAPAPSFARTARVVLVATAIGATAGAGVVLSLIDHPTEPEKTPVAARAIVTSVHAAAVPSVTPAAPAATAAPAGAPPQLAVSAPPSSHSGNAIAPAPGSAVSANTPAAAPAPTAPAASASPASATPPASAQAPNVAEAGPADVPDSATTATPDPAPPAKKAKHHANPKNAPLPGIGFILRRMFADHSGRSN
jgi:hypothetical protein